jgi:hypothetical protein
VVLGAQPGTPLGSAAALAEAGAAAGSGLACTYASTTSVLLGGAVLLSAPGDLDTLASRQHRQASENGSPAPAAAAVAALASATAHALASSPAAASRPATSGQLNVASGLAAAHAAVALRGATVYATVDFETREFLAARRGVGPGTARWAAASFAPWAPATRQWVLASPLWAPTHGDPTLAAAASAARTSQPVGSRRDLGPPRGAAEAGAAWPSGLWPRAAAAEWQVVDMDGALGSQACFAQPLVDAYHQQPRPADARAAATTEAAAAKKPRT